MQNASYGRQRNVRTRRRADGTTEYQVRVHPFEARTFLAEDEAISWAATLRGLRSQGVRFVPAHLRDEEHEGPRSACSRRLSSSISASSRRPRAS
jgi:hypothetical protein